MSANQTGTAMHAVIATDFGRITGAYWAPVSSNFNYAAEAVAYLSISGQAQVYAWREIRVLNKHARRPDEMWLVTGREHAGSLAENLERGKSLDPAIRAELEAAIISALQQDQRRAVERADYNNAARDEWGNIMP